MLLFEKRDDKSVTSFKKLLMQLENMNFKHFKSSYVEGMNFMEISSREMCCRA
jgi:hypothetical protein